MDKLTLQRILSDLQSSVPQYYRGNERTAYLTALLDMAQRITNQIEIEEAKS